VEDFNMVESKVTMKRKDYITICKELKEIDTDLNMYENKDNKDLIEATRGKINLIFVLLKEDC
jgi:hypothetical protein